MQRLMQAFILDPQWDFPTSFQHKSACLKGLIYFKVVDSSAFFCLFQEINIHLRTSLFMDHYNVHRQKQAFW